MLSAVHSGDLDGHADFYWKRAAAVRALAGTLSAPEARDALLRTADEYERLAEVLARANLFGDHAVTSVDHCPTGH